MDEHILCGFDGCNKEAEIAVCQDCFHESIVKAYTKGARHWAIYYFLLGSVVAGILIYVGAML